MNKNKHAYKVFTTVVIPIITSVILGFTFYTKFPKVNITISENDNSVASASNVKKDSRIDLPKEYKVKSHAHHEEGDVIGGFIEDIYHIEDKDGNSFIYTRTVSNSENNNVSTTMTPDN